MIATKGNDYRQLELESSNLLMQWDGRWVLGRYEEAAYTAWEAGALRVRMGQMRFDEGDFAEAAEDWLSAADCYLQATADKRAGFALELVQKLVAHDRLPLERPDLIAALREREEGVVRLRKKIQDLGQVLNSKGFPRVAASEENLAFLLEQVRELPGFARLHYEIYHQAARLGHAAVAGNHILWAANFDPDKDEYAALLCDHRIRTGRLAEAEQAGRACLEAKPNSGLVRLMLAFALFFASRNRPDAREEALEILRPLIDPSSSDLKDRIAALAVSLVLRSELGQEKEAAQLADEMEKLQKSVEDEELKATIADLRKPAPASPNGATSQNGERGCLISESDRLVFFEKVERLVTPAA